LDLQFDEEGGHVVVTNGAATRVPPFAHAPASLYRVKPADSLLTVVMTEGKVVKGRIVERLDDQLAPVPDAEIELQMPQPCQRAVKPATSGRIKTSHFEVM
jgi:hypothetical protein